ncbi:MAG: ketopantoate reductase C-terminal domain-containing protein, partial [Rectinema sp.]
RMTEIDAFAGEVVRLGAKLGVAVPVNRILYDAIKTIEADFPRSGYPQPDYPGSSYPGTKPDNSPEA